VVVNYKPVRASRFLHIFVVRRIFTTQPPEAMRIYDRITVYVNMFVINACRLDIFGLGHDWKDTKA
jgi:hypothetical protein